MDIKGVNPYKAISSYSNNRNKITKVDGKQKIEDRIEISKIGKTLNSYSIDEGAIDNSKKVQELKKKIEEGTYNIDAKTTAKSILDAIRESKL